MNPILKSTKYLKVPSVKADSVIHSYNHSIPQLSSIEDIKNLIHKSSIVSDPFLEQKQHEDIAKSQHYTELFAYGYYPSRNLGSSRHLSNDLFQIKGAGRNQLAAREDYHHAWGGMYLAEAFREYLISNHIRATAPEICINHFSFGTYQNANDNSFILRERYLPRPIQITPVNLDETEINSLCAALGQIGIRSLNDLVELHIYTFLKLFQLGLIHQSYNIENITLDAKIIDIGGINSQSFDSYLSLPVVLIKDKEMNYFHFLGRLLNIAVIPIGNILFPSQVYNLEENFYTAGFKSGFNQNELNLLYSYFHEPSKVPNAVSQVCGESKEYQLLAYNRPHFNYMYQERLRSWFNLWNKVRGISETEARELLAKIIQNPNEVF